MMVRRATAALWLVATVALGCGESAPPEPCLNHGPVSVTLPFARLVQTSHEAQSDLELVRFVFDRSVAGQVSALAEGAPPGHYVEAATDVPVSPKGESLISVRIDGLVAGAATDRMVAGPDEPFAIREIMQVNDDGGFRWIIGTIAGACVRLRANEEAAVIVLAVTAD